MKTAYEKEKIISIVIIIVSLIIMAVVGTIIILSHDKSDDGKKGELMPDIVGYSFKEVQACYERFFTLEIAGEDYSDKFAEGAILSQDNTAGTPYEKGKTTVRVTVSKGTKPVETTAPVTEPPAETTTVITEPPKVDGPIDNPVAAFETNNPSSALDITTCGLKIPDGRGTEIINELYSLMRSHGADAGFLYYNPENGGSIEYNADERFSSASIIKAVYARAILGAGIDLNAEYEMTEELLNSQYERVNDEPVGTMFTAEELIRAAVAESDNTAYKMLYHYIGFSDFNEYAKSLGLPQRMTYENYWFRMTARQTAAYFKDIYYFIEQHVNGALMEECMENAEYREMFSAALPDKIVAEKYGYLPQSDFYTLGDAGIVYGSDSDYVLVVYVRGTGTNLNTEFFREAAVLADELHGLLA
ncbi:MAG: serine hydrolase [Oscillospiraceae bacterium]|nr:serine hydrolase [Oscillospiraceae bacterium]